METLPVDAVLLEELLTVVDRLDVIRVVGIAILSVAYHSNSGQSRRDLKLHTGLDTHVGRLDICQDVVRESSVAVIVEAHIVRLVVEVRVEAGDTPLDKRRAQHVAYITRQDPLGAWIRDILITRTR